MHLASNGRFSNRPQSCHHGHPASAHLDLRRFLFTVGLLALFLGWFGAPSVWAASRDEQIEALRSQTNEAVLRVETIVNQPVTHLKHIPGMHPAVYSPGWFHPGATEPDYNTTDVRASQQMVYDGHQYVTSDLNPGAVFLASELEFNSMTKFFYTDRSLPKKKLTEAEMLEINSLYRTIGQCDKQLADLQNPESSLTMIHEMIATHKSVDEGILAALVVILISLNWRRRRLQQMEN